jgi:four helix bundle protein
MAPKRFEDLFVYQKAFAAAVAVSALLRRPSFGKDGKLRDQLGASSARVAALIAEGFGRKTDRHFAIYLYNARGSSKETRTCLHLARAREHISSAERDRLADRYNEIERMLNGLIKHLHRENRTLRG